MPRIPGEKTANWHISCVFSWNRTHTVKRFFFYCLFLWSPLPQISFLFPFSSSHCPVFASWITVNLPVSSSWSWFCSLYCTLARTQKHSISLLIILCPTLKFTPWSDDHPSFHLIFFTCMFYWDPTTASLSPSHEPGPYHVTKWAGLYCCWFKLCKIKPLFVPSISSCTVLAAHFQPLLPILPC